MYINCWLCGNLYCIQRQRSRRPSSSSGSETCEAHCDSSHHHPHLLVVTFSSQSIFLSSVCTKMRFNAYFLLRGNQRSPSELGNQLTKNSQIAPTFLQHLRLCHTQAILILILWQISRRPSSSSGSEALLAELANNSQPAGRELCRSLQSTTTTSRDRLPVCWKSTSSLILLKINLILISLEVNCNIDFVGSQLQNWFWRHCQLQVYLFYAHICPVGSISRFL